VNKKSLLLLNTFVSSACLYYPILIALNRLPIAHDSEGVITSWIPFLKSFSLYKEFPVYIPNYSFGLPNYFTMFQDPVSIFLITLFSLFSLQNLTIMFAIYILILNILLALMVKFICRSLNTNIILSAAITGFILCVYSPTWAYHFNFRLKFSVVVFIFSIIYLYVEMSLNRVLRISLLHFGFIIFGSLTYVLPVLYLTFGLVSTPLLVNYFREHGFKKSLHWRAKNYRVWAENTLLMVLNCVYLFLTVYNFRIVSSLSVVAGNRLPDGKVSFNDFLSYGGNVGWEKFLHFLGPYKSLAVTPDFSLIGGFLLLPLSIFGIVQIKKMQSIVRALYIGLMMSVVFILLFSWPVESVGKVLYYYVPFFDRMRHVAYVSSIVTTLTAFAAVLALLSFQNEQKPSKAMGTKHLGQLKKLRETPRDEPRFRSIRGMYMLLGLYALISPVLFHFFNLQYPKLLSLYPTREFICGLAPDKIITLEYKEICEEIYRSYALSTSLAGPKSIIDGVQWNLLIMVLIASLLISLATTLFNRKMGSRSPRRIVKSNLFLGLLILLVFGFGVINYQIASQVWSGGPFKEKGYRISTDYSGVYKPIQYSDYGSDTDSEPTFVNEHSMISIYLNRSACDKDLRVDLLSKSLASNSVQLKTAKDGSTSTWIQLCTKIRDSLDNQFMILEVQKERILPVKMRISYNSVESSFDLNGMERPARYTLLTALPYDSDWRLQSGKEYSTTFPNKNGFMSANIDTNEDLVTIKLQRSQVSIIIGQAFFVIHLFNFCYLLILILRPRKTVREES